MKSDPPPSSPSGTNFATARATPEPAASLTLVCFCIGEQEYGIDIMRVREVVTPLPLTRVADAPPFFAGIAALRGAFLGIIDLLGLLRASPGAESGVALAGAADLAAATSAALETAKCPSGSDRQKYVLVDLGDRTFGLIVDRVTEVRTISSAEQVPLSHAIPGGGRDRYLRVAAQVGDKVVLVIDIDRLLAPERRDGLIF